MCGLSNWQDDQQCLTHELWSELSEQIYQFLCGISLGDLVERKGVREVAARQHLQQNGQVNVDAPKRQAALADAS